MLEKVLSVLGDEFPCEVMWAGKLPEHSLAPHIAPQRERAALGRAGLGEAEAGEVGCWSTILYQPPPLLLVSTEGWFVLAGRSVWGGSS